MANGKYSIIHPFYGSVDFVRDNPGEPVPEETFTHSKFNIIQNKVFVNVLKKLTKAVQSAALNHKHSK